MRRFEAHAEWMSPALLPRYAAAVKRFRSREERFSARTLLAFAARGAEGFDVRAAADGETEILLYDEIGYWGVTAKEFVLALVAAGPGPITLRINSPGGDVFDGMAIYNALRARAAPVKCVVDGIAASAASFIAIAGQSMEMGEMSMCMIHKAWGFTIGNDDDHLDQAMTLAKIDGQLADAYARKTNKSSADMLAVMKAETWYTSSEAKAAGLCDVITTTPPAPLSASVKPGIRANMRRAQSIAAQLPDYDPDGDGDNDAEEALGMVNAAIVLLQEAAESLSGAPDDDETSEGAEPGDPAEPMPMPIVPGASAEAPEAAVSTHAARLRRLRLAEAEAA